MTYKIREKGNCRRSFLVFFYNAGKVRSILISTTVALILQCTFTIWLRGKQKEEKNSSWTSANLIMLRNQGNLINASNRKSNSFSKKKNSSTNVSKTCGIDREEIEFF